MSIEIKQMWNTTNLLVSFLSQKVFAFFVLFVKCLLDKETSIGQPPLKLYFLFKISTLRALDHYGPIVFPVQKLYNVQGQNTGLPPYPWPALTPHVQKRSDFYYNIKFVDKFWMNKDKFTRVGFEPATSGWRAGALPTELTSPILAVSLFC